LGDDLRGSNIPVHDGAARIAAVDALFEGLARGFATDGALLAAPARAHANEDAPLFLGFGLEAAHEVCPP
jgi:hypothetical protein